MLRPPKLMMVFLRKVQQRQSIRTRMRNNQQQLQ